MYSMVIPCPVCRLAHIEVTYTRGEGVADPAEVLAIDPVGAHICECGEAELVGGYSVYSDHVLRRVLDRGALVGWDGEDSALTRMYRPHGCGA